MLAGTVPGPARHVEHERAGALALTVERLEDGEVSPFLVDEVRAGDELELRGPIGGWFTWRPADGGPLVLLGGGSGLVPLMAMLRERAAAASAVPARLLVSARSREDLLYADELDELAAGGLELTVTLTRRAPDGWSGPTRRVDRAMLEAFAPPPAEAPRIYVCGPTSFVELAAAELVALGHDPAGLRLERFGATGG